MKKRGSSRKGTSASELEVRLRRLQARMRQANRQTAQDIKKNIRKFSILADAAERDLRRLRGVGKGALRAFRNELKRSWKDLKRVANEQF